MSVLQPINRSFRIVGPVFWGGDVDICQAREMEPGPATCPPERIYIPTGVRDRVSPCLSVIKNNTKIMPFGWLNERNLMYSFYFVFLLKYDTYIFYHCTSGHLKPDPLDLSILLGNFHLSHFLLRNLLLKYDN